MYPVKYVLLAFCMLGINNLNAQQLSYHADIASIITTNCTYCHKVGGSAPFALESYNDVKQHAKQIDYTVSHKIMPPWRADPTYRHFINERILTDTNVALITKWIAQGMQEGKRETGKHETNYKPLPKPDLSLQMPVKFTVPATNTDTVVRFIIPFKLPQDTFAYRIEVVPGNRNVIHHANPMIYDNAMPEYFSSAWEMLYTEVQSAKGTYNDTFSISNRIFYADFVPGAGPQVLPEGFGFRIPKDGYILFEVHYSASPVQQTDFSTISFYFTPTKPNRIVEPKRIGSGGGIAEPTPALVIPPNMVRTFNIDAYIPHELTLVMLGTHMHYLGKSMFAFCVTPRKDTIPLIKVNDYSFKWQESYRPEKLIHIPKGSHIFVTATFDNTLNNPDNPFNPPQLVKQGWRSTDEMMGLPIYITEYLPGDEYIENIR